MRESINIGYKIFVLMSSQLKGFLQIQISTSAIFLFFICLYIPITAVASDQFLSRGDELLTFVQSEALEARVMALQENISNLQTFRTRSTHHREATDNIVRYIANAFRSFPRMKVTEQVFGGVKNVVAVLPASTPFVE